MILPMPHPGAQQQRKHATLKERPILFAGEMVRAILDGRKTQTRRVAVGPNCPWGEAGERLWVRERWGYREQFENRAAPASGPIIYAADHESPQPGPWRASYHLTRAACRIVLEITSTRVERLRDMSRGDAIAEGYRTDALFDDPLAWFMQL